MKGKEFKFKNRHSWLVKLMTFVTVLATAYSLILPAVTVSATETYCNLEEHVHSEECDENCAIPEHVHTLQCESNPNADLEDASVWTASFGAAASMAPSSEKLAAIAASQVGYQESQANFTVLEDGTKASYSRYGQWAGAPYDLDWSADFINFCLANSGAASLIGPMTVGSSWYGAALNAQVLKEDPQQIQAGDIVFFDQEGKLSVGIAVQVSDAAVTAATKVGSSVSQITLDRASLVQKAFSVFPTEEKVSDPAVQQPEEKTEAENADKPSASVQNAQTVLAAADGCGFTVPFPATTTVTDETGTHQEPIIKNWTFQYKQPNEAQWKEYTEGTELKYNTQLRLTVFYQNLTKEMLDSANSGKYYLQIPSFTHSTESDSGTNLNHEEDGKTIVIGSINKCAEHPDHVHLHYSNYGAIDSDKIQEGTFYVSLGADLNEISKNPNPTVKIDGVDKELHLTFEEKADAHYAKISNFNKAKNPEGGNNIRMVGDRLYMDFQIFFDTGEFVLPNVVLDDWFTRNPGLISRYVPESITLKEGNGTPVRIANDAVQTNLGTSSEKTWNYEYEGKTYSHQVPGNGMSVKIGDCKANTHYVLSYTVEVNRDPLIGGKNTIRNSGRIVVNDVPRNSDYEETELKAEIAINKTDTSVTPDAEGNLLINYTLGVAAPTTNKYIVQTVAFKDMVQLKQSVDGNTLSGYAGVDDYLTFENMQIVKTAADGTRETVNMIPAVSAADETKQFELTFTDVAPGDRYDLTYQLKLDREVLAKMSVEQRNSLIVNNKADCVENIVTEGGHANAAQTNTEIRKNEWVQKNAASDKVGPADFDMSGHSVYALDGTAETTASYSVPANTLEYTVKVNDDGVANVDNSVFTDTLRAVAGDLNMFHYQGYMAVEVFKGPQINGNQENLLDTIYVKLPDQQKSFEFKPNDYARIRELAAAQEQGVNLSYRLKYYVSPADSSVTATVENTMSGTIAVGVGGTVHRITSESRVTEWMSSSMNISGSKKGVMVLERENEVPEYQYGRILWLVKVENNSNILPAGFTVHDILSEPGIAGGRNSHFNSDALIGMYLTDYDFSQSPFNNFTFANDISSFGNFTYEELMSVLETGKVDSGNYETSFVSPGNRCRKMDVQLTKQLNMGGKALYLLIQSTPDAEIEHFINNRATFAFSNNAEYSFGGSAHSTLGNATIKTRHFGLTTKTAAADFVWDDGIKVLYKNSSMAFSKDQLGSVLNQEFPEGEGLKTQTYYNDWAIEINNEPRNPQPPYSGTFEVVEHLPANSKFVKAYLSSGTDDQLDASVYPSRTEQLVKTVVNEGEVRFTIENVQAHNPFTLHVVTEYTGSWSDLLAKPGDSQQRRNQEAFLLNKADIYCNGNKIGNAQAERDQHIEDILSKTGPGNEGSQTLDFTIELNKAELDLVPGDTIDLTDTFNSSIRIDQGTLKIENMITEKPITGYTVEYSDIDEKGMTTMTIWKLPDHTPIRITYTALIQTTPGNTVNVSNKVSWIGYGNSTPEDDYNQNYYYQNEGISTSSIYEKLRVLKVDKNNAEKKLQGAQFELYKLETPYTQESEENKELIDTFETDANGQIVISQNDELLEKNTLYMIKETAAPEKYILDETPNYFFYRDLDSSYQVPALPEGTRVRMHNAEISYSIQNAKPTVDLKIKKTFAGGKVIPGVYHFGVYSKPIDEPSQYVKRLSLEIPEGSTADFAEIDVTGLDKEGTYYIYELDPDTREPLAYNSKFETDGNRFTVTGENTQINVEDENADLVACVDNDPMYMLPATGGIGDLPYLLTGAAVSAGAVLYMIDRKKRSNKK